MILQSLAKLENSTGQFDSSIGQISKSLHLNGNVHLRNFGIFHVPHVVSNILRKDMHQRPILCRGV